MLIHWEYPSFCIISTLLFPILSGAVLITKITNIIIVTPHGAVLITKVTNIVILTPHGAVLIFTGLRIRAALRRQSVHIRRYQNTPEPSFSFDCQQQSAAASKPSVRRSTTTLGSRRTLKILTFTSVAFFTFWSPYVVVVLTESFVRSFKPPSAVEFAVMWLANTNSAVNVFIYSSTNTQFRRQCVLLASRFCSCSRLSSLSSSEHPNPSFLAVPVPAINLSAMNVQSVGAPATNSPDIVVTLSREDGDGGGGQFLTVPCGQLRTVDSMKQVVCTDTLVSDEDEHCL